MAVQETLENPAPAANGHRPEAQDAPIESHPLAGILGAFRDDPEYDALMERVEEHRREMEAEEAGAETARVRP